MDLGEYRLQYETEGLALHDVAPDPIDQFHDWFGAAEAAGVDEPNAVTVSTVVDGWPDARVVLLKVVDARGLVFYTNFESAKGRQLTEVPRAALTILWNPLRRQVRVRGSVELIDGDEADRYFATRPRGSQLGAWTSPQSTVIGDRSELEARYAALEQEYEGIEVPRPARWGGVRVIPIEVEFWQGRPNRLHDRLRYRRAGDEWVIERLAP
ncbi:MAG: pyridoxamine 5'-phosphate oxidase [Acidimicrobiia bacterium]|nr:pyridoxamine 5'-phosphate oxidase [Acidimicrobiia bacterium]